MNRFAYSWACLKDDWVVIVTESINYLRNQCKYNWYSNSWVHKTSFVSCEINLTLFISLLAKIPCQVICLERISSSLGLQLDSHRSCYYLLTWCNSVARNFSLWGIHLPKNLALSMGLHWGAELKWRVIYLATARERLETLRLARAFTMQLQVVQLNNIDISCVLLCI